MSKKKNPSSKKKQPEKRSLTEQFLQVADHVFSYFEILLLYVRKSLSQKLRHSVITSLIILNLSLINLAGTFFVLHGIYSQLLELYQNNPVYASYTLGLSLILLTGIPMALIIRKISI